MSQSDNSTNNSRPRLLLVGAGETEVGRLSRNGSGEPDLRGAVLPHLLDNLLGPPPNGLFVSEDKRRYKISHVCKFENLPVIRTSRQKVKQIYPLDAERVRRAMFLADIKSLNGVVILIDREKRSQPDRAARMKKGRLAYRNVNGASRVACAVGAACRCVETWLLSDQQARQTVFGHVAPNPFSVDPEDRPPPRQLKKYIEEWAKKCGISRAEAYKRLAKAARPKELKRQCRTSYPPFATDVKTEIAPLV